MIVVGLTGNLSTGKSAVAEIFHAHGAKCFDADLSAKSMLKKGRPAYQAVIKMFGREFVSKGGELDRKKLALRVFSKPEDLKKLNILVHPGVIFEALALIQKFKKEKGILVLDVPLLFESKMDGLADFTVVVKSPLEASFKRSEEKGIPRALAKKILSSQWPIAKKAKHADFVIDNNGSLKDLEKKVLEVIKKINQVKGGIK